MKSTIRKIKDIRGRRIVGYRASFGPIDGSHTEPKKAADDCEANTLAALARLDRGTHVFVWRKHVIVVSPDVYGWRYWIDTFSADGYHVSAGSRDPEHRVQREDAEDAALHHLAQNIWELTVTDDEAFLVGLPKGVQEELRGWISFQRDYARLRAEGLSDVEAHQKAKRSA